MSLKSFFLGTHRLKPLHIELNGSPDRLAGALHGLAHMVNRRRDLNGQQISITLTIRDNGSGR
ncbi:hypothetical protein AB0J68_04840 [Micromonospora sp. NPDC049580]|uniref:hypothetical protein n=1 Tax=Micromonospora TaxID=1873 RepID=UPI001B37CFA3|nr:hypothetical protein [Micromonospora sp. M61]MBQ0977557.1 hypothetical protein [Micromonospora sp. M61]